jgi:hypothetical protein
MVSVWIIWCAASVASAQSTAATPPLEEVEPHVIGVPGTTKVGFAGYLDRLYSSERIAPTNYTIQLDFGRFVSGNFVVRGGLAGSGSRGGDDADKLATGRGVPALHAFGGMFFYFTPQSIWSLYSGAEYWTQLTQRAVGDKGSVMGALGIEGTLSSRVSLFFQGGYGIGLTGATEKTTRLIGRVGVRLKL